MAVIEMTECPMCHGTGRLINGSRCDQCKGTGKIPVLETPEEEDDLED